MWCWSFLVFAADLKVTLWLYIHWATAGACVVLGLPTLLRQRYRLRHPVYLAATTLILAMLLSAVTSPEPAEGAKQALKLVAILFGGMSLFVTHPKFARTAISAAVAAAVVNAALLGGGALFGLPTAYLLAPGRWGTALNWPGSLWRVGAVVFVYSLYRSGAERGRRRWLPLLTLAGSAACIVGDGSRTALALIPIAVLFWLYVIISERRLNHMDEARLLLRLSGTAIATLGLAWFILLRPGVQDESAQGGLARIRRTLPSAPAFSTEGAEGADPARMEMLQAAIAAVVEHPFTGGGIGSTRIDTEFGPMVVHVSYLQVWGDLGPLGAFSFAALALGWLTSARAIMRAARLAPSALERALYYNGVFQLAVFAFAALFHPLSTEWSEWLPYIIGVSLCTAARSSRADTSNEAVWE